MNLDYFPDARSAAFEKDFWWTRSRFGLIDLALERLPEKVSVLEIGCGTGINLEHLRSKHGGRLIELVGVDPLAEPGPREIPAGTTFDLVLLMDVIEHADDPVALLEAARQSLKPGGLLLVTVPAFQWLWTRFDVLAHHKKRYVPGGLLSELKTAGFAVERWFFLFALLFPAFVAQRLALRLFPFKDERVFRPVHPAVNEVLYRVTAFERRTFMSWNRWFGSTLAAFARKD